MGRLESLTSLALGRTPYEDTIVEDLGEVAPIGQLYNEHGRPRNPETKRRERENVRAANEVMQVTGVVEDALAAKAKATEYSIQKTQDTITGLRIMEVGRAVLVAGVWGVLGLRRRILLYRPYSELSLLGIIKQEMSVRSIPSLLLSGTPVVMAYHIPDWVDILLDAFLDRHLDEDEHRLTSGRLRLNRESRICIDITLFYISLHFRMFAVLHQLHLIPSSQLLPSLKSFIPFAAMSPFELPPSPTFSLSSVASWGISILRMTYPMLTLLFHGKVKSILSRLLYRPIYLSLPRPLGESMFEGFLEAPTVEFDAPDRIPTEQRTTRGEDPQTLRALEGLPTLNGPEEHPRILESDEDSSEEEGAEVAQARMISFDVEATEAVDNPLGSWSAELRSADPPRSSKGTDYRVTGLTLQPTVSATEVFREVMLGFIMMPIEAVMVRVIARAYRKSAGMGVSDLYHVGEYVPAIGNLFQAMTLQLAITGVIWAGFTVGAQFWAKRNKEKSLGNDESGVE